jgi:hypothetical protein
MEHPKIWFSSEGTPKVSISFGIIGRKVLQQGPVCVDLVLLTSALLCQWSVIVVQVRHDR